MWYYPADFLVGKRDVIGAWLVCLIVAAVCFGSPMLTAPSDPPGAARHAAASTEHDLIVTSGGVSTGEEDHVKTAIERLGSLYFWRLAIKPGRPVALGQIGGVPLIGLPGNPVAVVVTFAVLARPLILKLTGAAASPPRLFRVRADFGYRKKPGRREYVRACVRHDGSSILAVKYPKDGAGILSSIVESDGLVILDESTGDLVSGTDVDFLPFSEVIG